jgi:hypothetical protein
MPTPHSYFIGFFDGRLCHCACHRQYMYVVFGDHSSVFAYLGAILWEHLYLLV